MALIQLGSVEEAVAALIVSLKHSFETGTPFCFFAYDGTDFSFVSYFSFIVSLATENA